MVALFISKRNAVVKNSVWGAVGNNCLKISFSNFNQINASKTDFVYI